MKLQTINTNVTDNTKALDWKQIHPYNGKCVILKGEYETFRSGSVKDESAIALQAWHGWSSWHCRIFCGGSFDIWKADGFRTEDEARECVEIEAARRGLINSLNELKE